MTCMDQIRKRETKVLFSAWLFTDSLTGGTAQELDTHETHQHLTLYVTMSPEPTADTLFAYLQSVHSVFSDEPHVSTSFLNI